MFDQLLPILVLLAVSIVLASLLSILSSVIGKKTSLGAKTDAYECGIEPTGTTRDPVPVKFYMIAISFILFDLEVIFLFPWALVARDLGMFGFLNIAVFALVILVGYIYELSRGALTWD